MISNACRTRCVGPGIARPRRATRGAPGGFMMKATTRLELILCGLALMLFGIATLIQAQAPSTPTVVTSTSVTARDPGMRGGPAGAGGPIYGLTARQFEFFTDGKADFEEVEAVAEGLGPRMNLDSCAGCHAQPATGGTSPFVNPQVKFASKDGGTDQVPFFITLDGPVREARFKFNPDGSRDGGVHNTATITGRTGADGCVLAQPDLDAAAATNNLVFRIPTPVFGAGLIEQIPDRAILANQAANAATKKHYGIGGRPHRKAITGSTNNNGNDGTI